MKLDSEQLRELAVYLADELEQRAIQRASRPRLVDVAELASRLGVSRDFVYRHGDRLGAVRLGNGPKARLRFDPEEAAKRLTAVSAGSDSSPPILAQQAASRPRRRRGSGTAVPHLGDAPLLPIRGLEVS